tara:strand:- start:642 stop:1289 length:648 start_codon:yes stop_codon:yes gene_type:complete
MKPTSMLQHSILLIPITALAGFLATSLQASERAHEHGVGQLSIAIEGNEVEIELVVPGADAVGFEHAARTDSERKAVVAATEKLKEAKRLIRLTSGAHCHLEKTEVASALLDGDKDGHDHAHDHKHKHEKHAKQDEHKHNEHKEHKEHDKHADGEIHSEFTAHYHFHCDHPEKLTGADVEFFKVFPSAHELVARWITSKGQGITELTAKATRLKF